VGPEPPSIMVSSVVGPDPDPEFQVNPDTDTDPDPSWIQGFDDQKLKKKIQRKMVLSYFDQKLQFTYP
jgi:hypothetical protein